jgi:nitroreductase
MSLQQNLRWRYAVKKFDCNKPVSDATVDAILEAGNLSASSFGLQPYQFVVVKDQSVQDKLVEVSWNQNQVAEASHLIVIAVRSDVDHDYISDYVSMMESQRDMPTGALDPYKDMILGSVGRMAPDALHSWAVKQAYIAMGSLLAACADLRVDSCPMEGFLPAEYDEILGLDERHLNAVLVLPIGYRAAEDKHQHFKKVRKPLEDMVVRIGE